MFTPFRNHEHGPLVHEQMYASLYTVMRRCLVERKQFSAETPHNKACGLQTVTFMISMRKHNIIIIFWGGHEKADISTDNITKTKKKSQQNILNRQIALKVCILDVWGEPSLYPSTPTHWKEKPFSARGL